MPDTHTHTHTDSTLLYSLCICGRHRSCYYDTKGKCVFALCASHLSLLSVILLYLHWWNAGWFLFWCFRNTCVWINWQFIFDFYDSVNIFLYNSAPITSQFWIPFLWFIILYILSPSKTKEVLWSDVFFFVVHRSYKNNINKFSLIIFFV